MVDRAFDVQLARLDGSIGVGPFDIREPVFVVHDEAGKMIVGSSCLEHFTITFDLEGKGGLVRFARDADAPVVAGAQRVLGFDVDAVDGDYLVGDVVPGSPAEAAGLTVGARVVSIDGRPIEELHGTSRWTALSEQAGLRLEITADGTTRALYVPIFEIIPAS
jgi:predicted metalloprotease with PDZ domain